MITAWWFYITILKNMMDFVNGFRMTSHMKWKIIQMFETTNQILSVLSNVLCIPTFSHDFPMFPDGDGSKPWHLVNIKIAGK